MEYNCEDEKMNNFITKAKEFINIAKSNKIENKEKKIMNYNNAIQLYDNAIEYYKEILIKKELKNEKNEKKIKKLNEKITYCYEQIIYIYFQIVYNSDSKEEKISKCKKKIEKYKEEKKVIEIYKKKLSIKKKISRVRPYLERILSDSYKSLAYDYVRSVENIRFCDNPQSLISSINEGIDEDEGELEEKLLEEKLLQLNENLGNCYFEIAENIVNKDNNLKEKISNYYQAIDAYWRAINIREEMDQDNYTIWDRDEETLSNLHESIGNAYYQIKLNNKEEEEKKKSQNCQAIDAYHEAISYYKNDNNTNFFSNYENKKKISYLYESIGNCYCPVKWNNKKKEKRMLNYNIYKKTINSMEKDKQIINSSNYQFSTQRILNELKINNYYVAINNYQTAISFSNDDKDTEKLSDLYEILAYSYFYIAWNAYKERKKLDYKYEEKSQKKAYNNYNNAVNAYKKAIKYCDNVDKKRLSYLYELLAYSYFLVGWNACNSPSTWSKRTIPNYVKTIPSYNDSIDAYLKAIKYCDNTNKERLSSLYESLGISYFQVMYTLKKGAVKKVLNYKKGKKAYKEAIKYCDNTNKERLFSLYEEIENMKNYMNH